MDFERKGSCNKHKEGFLHKWQLQTFKQPKGKKTLSELPSGKTEEQMQP